jgi:methyl-accepting chemotaxis protein
MTLDRAAAWIGLVLGPLGVVISIFGFGLALWQIRKVRSAAQAASSASSRAARSVAQNQILFLIPDLQRIASDLGEAVDQAPDRLARLIDHWRTSAIRIRSLLRTLGLASDELLTGLTRSLAQATDAKERIRRQDADAAEVTRTFRRTVDRVIEELGDLGGQMLVQVEHEENQG